MNGRAIGFAIGVVVVVAAVALTVLRPTPLVGFDGGDLAASVNGGGPFSFCEEDDGAWVCDVARAGGSDFSEYTVEDPDWLGCWTARPSGANGAGGKIEGCITLLDHFGSPEPPEPPLARSSPERRPVLLAAEPPRVAAGDEIRFTVDNRSPEAVSFGLGGELEKFVGDEEWDEVPGFHPPLRRIRLLTPSRETSGPEYADGDVVDAIRIPASLDPGKYRLRRRFEAGQLLIGAAAVFAVRP